MATVKVIQDKQVFFKGITTTLIKGVEFDSNSDIVQSNRGLFTSEVGEVVQEVQVKQVEAQPEPVEELKEELLVEAPMPVEVLVEEVKAVEVERPRRRK